MRIMIQVEVPVLHLRDATKRATRTWIHILEAEIVVASRGLIRLNFKAVPLDGEHRDATLCRIAARAVSNFDTIDEKRCRSSRVQFEGHLACF